MYSAGDKVVCSQYLDAVGTVISSWEETMNNVEILLVRWKDKKGNIWEEVMPASEVTFKRWDDPSVRTPGTNEGTFIGWEEPGVGGGKIASNMRRTFASISLRFPIASSLVRSTGLSESAAWEFLKNASCYWDEKNRYLFVGERGLAVESEMASVDKVASLRFFKGDREITSTAFAKEVRNYGV